jgi:hypothetical protein
MDQMTATAIQEARALLKAGKQPEARAVLIQIILADESRVEAWYLLGVAATKPDKRMVAFQRVLGIDPANQAAKKQIAVLRGAPQAVAVRDSLYAAGE